MNRYLFKFVNRLSIRAKMLVVVLPLVVLPLILAGGLIGVVAVHQAYQGLTSASKADLDHMADFTLDLLDAHYRQYEVYQDERKRVVQQEMAALVNLAHSLVATAQTQLQKGEINLSSAQKAARNALKSASIGGSGYLYAMTSKGLLTAHLAREGENVYDEQDEDGRYFIRELCRRALASKPGEILYTVYPWRNTALGETRPRRKIVAYRYFREWDWIIAAGGYLDETYEENSFEQASFAILKAQIKTKQVGKTGYIYSMDRTGTLMIHPDAEGQNISAQRDSENRAFIAEMIANKEGWIRYPWLNQGEKKARMKIVRYRYFEPWDWIVAVGSYEDEFYRPANQMKMRIIAHVLLLPLLVGLIAVTLVFLAAKVLTDPIHEMIAAIRRVKQGRMDEQIKVDSQDELGELAQTFNRMIKMLRQHKEMETALAQQGKMASLGVLSSGVAHEINNPLGVILGYAGYLEKKISPEDPNYHFIHEIKRESKRCKKIVQDLLSYARTPKPVLEATDLNALLKEIVEFSANLPELRQVHLLTSFAPGLARLPLDADQMRQVSINLILNGAASIEGQGQVGVETRPDGKRVAVVFTDNGSGIPAENLEKIFEPFFTTKARGTGLGLAITKQIIDQHQGEIFIESTVGQGTRVTLLLPIEREEY
ncbi:MAG: HAMP domain-containing protein [Deltaproteobacteria bacterium]|nr:HAMP domain-containing protein [Deltaproteobacteria bacterium]NCP02155.1 HAMP domain-containing protein [Deltaproteobacteria bacterium]